MIPSKRIEAAAAKRRATRWHKLGVIVGIFAGSFTFAGGVSQCVGDTPHSGCGWPLFNAAIVLVCTYGLWRRSANAAWVLLVHLIYVRWVTYLEYGRAATLVGGIVYAFFWLQALRALLFLRNYPEEYRRGIDQGDSDCCAPFQ